MYRMTLRTPQRSLSLGWMTIGVKALMGASDLGAMSEDEVIVAWGDQ